MNIAEAQREIVNALLSGGTVRGFDVDERTMLVSVDGYMGYILPISSIVFSLDKVVKKGCRPVVEVIKEENELTLTPDLRLDSEFGRKKVLRRLKGNGKNVFLNIKYMECFQNPKFFQDKDKYAPVVVTEGAKGDDIPVGFICPVRCSWADGYYSDMQED